MAADAADYKKASSRPPSFRPKRSGVEKSHSSIVQEAWRREISRLRVSSERLPSAPYRHAAPLEMTVAAGTPIVISTTAEWRNLLSLIVRAALRREISRLRASWERFLSAPIPTHTPARDDGGGGHPYRHFDRSGAEWRNLTPLMTEKPAPALSSFRPKRSGVEKSPSFDCTGGITVGDLSTQSIMGAVPVYLPYRYVPPLEMMKEPCLDPSKKRPQRGASAFDFIH